MLHFPSERMRGVSLRLFGDPGYLLRVVAIDLNDYATLRDKKLATLPGVQRITSTIVMKRIVDNQPLPLPGTRSRKARGPWARRAEKCLNLAAR